MRRSRVVFPLAVFVVGALVGVAVVGKTAEQPMSIDLVGAQGAQEYYGPIVFYSGLGEAGVRDADPYSGWEFVDNNEWLGPKYSDWTVGDCKPDRADDFPGDRGLHMLVGYSLGRLGPVYFLRAAPGRWSEIDTIYILDPGSFGEFSENPCDSGGTERPSAVLERWLAGSANRTLVIVSSESSNRDGGAGITSFYLYDLYRTRQDVADRVLYCIDDQNTSHGAVVKEFIGSLKGERSCPPHSHREPVHTLATPTTPTTSAPDPVVPTVLPTTPTIVVPPTTHEAPAPTTPSTRPATTTSPPSSTVASPAPPTTTRESVPPTLPAPTTAAPSTTTPQPACDQSEGEYYLNVTSEGDGPTIDIYELKPGCGEIWVGSTSTPHALRIETRYGTTWRVRDAVSRAVLRDWTINRLTSSGQWQEQFCGPEVARLCLSSSGAPGYAKLN